MTKWDKMGDFCKDILTKINKNELKTLTTLKIAQFMSIHFYIKML